MRLFDRNMTVFLIGLFVLVVLVPILQGNVLPGYAVQLVGKYLCYALLAVALDLVWGYAGILSLGHGAFFALGAYVMGMHLMREIGARGVYANPELPDFMVFLNWDSLPWFWQASDSLLATLVLIVAVPGLLAFVFGWFAFRARVNGVYLSIITQAMTYALMLAFFRNEMGFGGNNGLTDFRDLMGVPLAAPGMRLGLFIASALALVAGLLIARALTSSRFGRVLVAIRDSESRTRFLGYRVENYKLFVWTVSAMMAGVAGALYVPQVGIVNPGEFAPANSIEIVIWVALGGRGTLVGAALGAITVALAKTLLTGWLPDAWLYVLGALFILVTLYLPKGIVGWLDGLRRAPRPTTKEAAA